MNFVELLSIFKSGEEPEVLVQISNDPHLQNAMVAWQCTIVDWPTDGGEQCPESDRKRQWAWLWQQIKYDSKTFGATAGLKEHEVNAVLTRLINLRLVYPDGTISSLAKRFIQGMIMAKLPKAAKKQQQA